MEKNKKVFNIKALFLSLTAALFTVIFGTIFSGLTGYKAKEQELLCQLLVWSADIVLSYSLSWVIFCGGKNRIKYTYWVSWGLSIIICTILVILICETFELVFVATISTTVPLGGYLVNLIKKNYANDKTQGSSKPNNKVNDAKKNKSKKTKPRKS